jgi:hypothetical protein
VLLTLNAELGQELEELSFELMSLICGDGLWATEAGYPAGQWDACHGVAYDVRDGVNSVLRVKQSIAVRQYG